MLLTAKCRGVRIPAIWTPGSLDGFAPIEPVIGCGMKAPFAVPVERFLAGSGRTRAYLGSLSSQPRRTRIRPPITFANSNVYESLLGWVSPIFNGGAGAQNSIQEPCCAPAGEACGGDRCQASQHRQLRATLAEN